MPESGVDGTQYIHYIISAGIKQLWCFLTDTGLNIRSRAHTNTGSRSPTTIPGPNRRDSVTSGSDAALAVALRSRPTFRSVLDASVVAARHNHLLLRNIDVSTRLWAVFERGLTAQAAHSVVRVHLVDGNACR